jgi:RadC-like JAB domain
MPNPSDTDRRFTHSVSLAASTMQIQLLDHLIMGAPADGRASYFSFKEAGRSSSHNAEPYWFRTAWTQRSEQLRSGIAPPLKLCYMSPLSHGRLLLPALRFTWRTTDGSSTPNRWPVMSLREQPNSTTGQRTKLHLARSSESGCDVRWKTTSENDLRHDHPANRPRDFCC